MVVGVVVLFANEAMVVVLVVVVTVMAVVGQMAWTVGKMVVVVVVLALRPMEYPQRPCLGN